MPFTFFRNGRPVHWSTGEYSEKYAEENPDCVLVDGASYDETFYLQNGEVKAVPPQTNPLHYFDYNAGAWVADEVSAWRQVRYKRNELLLQSDWTDTASAQARMGEAMYNAWQAYRQALRDVTSQPDPFNITWPQPPSTS